MVLSFKKHHLFAVLLLIILASNITLYHTSFGRSIIPANSSGVVLGSMLDIILFCPILLMLYLKKMTIKHAIIFFAAGCIAVRFIIPLQHLEPFKAVSYIGFAIEGAFILFELALLAAFIRYVPRILKSVRSDQRPLLYSFTDAIRAHTSRNPIVQIFCSEMLVFYYALFSWKKPIPTGITLYKNSSLLAFQIMMIHAIIIETIGIHYWLHSKMPLLSIILLVLNIYSVVFFLADIQALRLTPVHVTKDAMYLSLGMIKRAKVEFANIEEIIDDPQILQQKPSKDTLDFVARDFETVHPQIILKMKTPQKAVLAMGMEKQFNYVAIKCDQIEELKRILSEKIA